MLKETITELFEKIIFLEVREVKLGYGSFVTIGFGKDLSFTIKVRGKIESYVRPEWRLWIYMSFWELKENDKLLAVKMKELR